ncbi:MAG: hypothetical protein ACXVCI_16530 [Bdellovibrionota bacterium]
MKNGFFKLSNKLPLLMALLCLQGCASFLQLGENAEDTGDYDRGYARDASGNQDDQVANTETQGRDPASDTSSELNYEQRRIKRAIEMRDVVLGMTRHDVTESWGQPAQREVAGRGTGGHERWVFGSRYSLSGSRTVIFENGKVAGWSH